MQMLSTERSLLPSIQGMEMKDEGAIFPQDIIIEILKKLPVKSLIRFQSVCKLWNNLIKSPSFISTHLHYSAHNNPFLLIGGTPYSHNSKLLLSLDSNMKIDVQTPVWKPLTNSIEYAPAWDPRTDSTMYNVKLVCSCNGLFFVEIKYAGSPDDDYFFYDISLYSHFLWNPATREARKVPMSTSFCFGSCISSVGFGFSHVLNDYKIVKIDESEIIYRSDQHVVKKITNYVEVYSLRRGSWKIVESEVLDRVRYLKYIRASSCNEAMFWLGVVRDDGHDLHMVVSFDIVTEICSLIPIPSSIITPHPPDSDVRLTVYENKLAMFCHSYENGNDDFSFIDLWVMEEGDDASGKSWSWTKKYSISPPSNWLYTICVWKNVIVCTNMAYVDYTFRPDLGLHESENQVMNGANFCLSLFNLTTNEWTASRNFIGQVCSKINIFNYVESLVKL